MNVSIQLYRQILKHLREIYVGVNAVCKWYIYKPKCYYGETTHKRGHISSVIGASNYRFHSQHDNCCIAATSK